MKTISTAYYEKMAEAKQTFCAFCMRGAMPFLEDCKDCKINPVSYTHLDVYKRQLCSSRSRLFLCPASPAHARKSLPFSAFKLQRV